MIYLIFFISGLITGSFFNVCIYRLPRKESVVFPPSRCPLCQTRLTPRDLVPLFSYLWLKGCCRYCQGRISWRYPAVELLTGLLFMMLYAHFGFNLWLVKYLILTCLLMIISFIDLEHYFIPDQLILLMLGTGILLNFFTRELPIPSILWGMLVLAGTLFLLAALSKGGMGGGDIKLAGAAGLFLGWPQSLLALFLAGFLGGIFSLILLIFQLKKRKDPLPFAPFLSGGIILTVFFGQALLKWYFSL
ncbi:MAG TPA: prepilin peptidase [Desulfotomaculum sp.]|nr:prepilin peptidase [Desulfotomaculum sp.]